MDKEIFVNNNSKLVTIFGALVPTFFTTKGGVSISEVARLQAEAKQQNDTFWARLTDATRGVFRKVVSFVGAGSSVPQTVAGPTISVGEIGGYGEVAARNASTAVFMHGVKLFKSLQERLEVMDLRLFVVEKLPEAPPSPERPQEPSEPTRAKSGTVCDTPVFMMLGNIDEMIAGLKPEVLARFDFAFWKRANELNARAAVIGKLLSEQGSFFREVIKPLPSGGEQVTQAGVVIFRYEKAYSPDELVDFVRIRETLQAEYNDLQKQLNGLKKQIKDAVRAYNLEQERQYQAAYGEYRLAYASYQAAVKELLVNHQDALKRHAQEMERIRSSAETLRQEALAEMATLRVRTE